MTEAVRLWRPRVLQLAGRKGVWPVAIGALFVGEALLLLVGARHQWYFFDEWRLVVERVIPDPSGLHAWFQQLFRPDGEHVVAIPLAVFVVLCRWFGIDNYYPFVVANTAVRLATMWLVLDLTRRLGARRVAQFVAVGLVALFGTGFESLFGQSLIFAGMTLVFALAALRAVLVPDRSERWHAGFSAGWLVLSVFCSSYAFPVVVGVSFLYALERRWRPAAASLVVPPVAFLVVRRLAGGAYGQQQPFGLARVPLYIDYVQAGLTTVGEGVTGLEGLGIASFVLVVVAMALLARRRPEQRFAAAVVVTVVSFYAQASLSRSVFGAEQASASRYAFFCGVLLIVSMAGAWGDRRVPIRTAGIVVLVLAMSLGSNIGRLIDGRAFFLQSMDVSRGRLLLGMVAVERGVPAFRPDTQNAPDLYDERLDSVLRWSGSASFIAHGERCYDDRLAELAGYGIDLASLTPHQQAALVLLLNEHALGTGENLLSVTGLLVMASQDGTGSPVIDAFADDYDFLVQTLPQIDAVPDLRRCL